MSKAININNIMESDNVSEFIEFLRISSKTKNVKLLLPAFEDFMPDTAVECKKLISFIRDRNSTDLTFLLDSYEQKLNQTETPVHFYRNENTL